MPDRSPAPASGLPLPPIDEQTCFALYTASRAVTDPYRPLLEGNRLRDRAVGIPKAIGEAIGLPEEEFEATRMALGRLTANMLIDETRPTGPP